MTNKILIFIETEETVISNVSLEIISYAANNFSNQEINGIILTSPQYRDNLVSQLQNKGVNNLYIYIDEQFKDYLSQAFVATISEFINQNHQNIFLMGATPMGRELAPRIAARNDLGLTADCTHIDINEEGKLLATRPTYGGKLMATIISKTEPNFATVRPGALKSSNTYFDKQTNVIDYNVEISSIVEAIKILQAEKLEIKNDLDTAQIIIAGGLGLKTKENFELIKEFADLIGATPAGTRAAVEIGWATPDMQVGQTGRTVAPKLYLAFGISGAMQHLVGISNSDKIIAVNIDRNAPIFESANIGIVTDAAELLKTLIAAVREE